MRINSAISNTTVDVTVSSSAASTQLTLAATDVPTVGTDTALDSTTIGAIAGGVAGFILLTCIVIVLVVRLRGRRKGPAPSAQQTQFAGASTDVKQEDNYMSLTALAPNDYDFGNVKWQSARHDDGMPRSSSDATHTHYTAIDA
jgi:hypothetical protein